MYCSQNVLTLNTIHQLNQYSTYHFRETNVLTKTSQTQTLGHQAKTDELKMMQNGIQTPDQMMKVWIPNLSGPYLKSFQTLNITTKIH